MSGTVQGVGFRPFVFRLARAHRLAGWVLNDDAGVQIHVEGAEEHVARFLTELSPNAPPAARITAINVEPDRYTCRRRSRRAMPDETCTHIEAIETVKQPNKRECQECVKIGSRWVHLRTCQECGGTHCCDNSPNRHATKHARATGHPVIASAEPGEQWLYCYPDDQFVEY